MFVWNTIVKNAKDDFVYRKNVSQADKNNQRYIFFKRNIWEVVFYFESLN